MGVTSPPMVEYVIQVQPMIAGGIVIASKVFGALKAAIPLSPHIHAWQ
jgi:hypothetical protein